jgi:dipeptidyl aminopeptidase/acylaminoacyl peptidase
LRQLPKGDDLPDRVTYLFDFDAAGETGVLVMGSSKSMGELYATSWKAGGEMKKLFDLNPQSANWKLPTIKHITWKAKDGSTCGGVLELPAGYDGKTKLPLVVSIHGGPTTSTKACLEYDPHNGRLYFSAHGYAVLQPNYRGSTGYGDQYLTDLIGKENDVDVSDIVDGVMHLVKEGIADPERVASMGWSNGGYLTNCLITKKNLPFKLKAASSGAGIVDTVLEWGSNDEPAYPKAFKKGHPWETPDVYKQTSPTYGLGNVTTPTLIHVGGNDERCPPGNSRMLYRALKEFVNVPTELVVYPGEPHGLTKKSHRKAKMEWDLAWFEKYLK